MYRCCSRSLVVGIVIASLAAPALLRAACEDELPEWAVNKRDDSPPYLYEIGIGTSTVSPAEAKIDALRHATRLFAARIVSEIHADAAPSSPPPIQELDFVETFPGAEYTCTGATNSVWLLARYPRAEFEAEIERRNRPITLWTEAESAFAVADAESDPARKAALETVGRNSLSTIIAEYPVGGQDYFETEHALFRLAERSAASGNPCAARDFYARVRDHSIGETWLMRAGRRLKQIRCDDDEWDRYLLSRLCDQKRIALRCCLHMDGQPPERYGQLYASVSQLLTGAGAVVEDPGCDGREGTTADLDVVLIVEGKVEEGSDRYTLSGNLKSVISSAGADVFRDDFPVMAAKPTKDICLYALGVRVAETWQEHLLATLGSGR